MQGAYTSQGKVQFFHGGPNMEKQIKLSNQFLMNRCSKPLLDFHTFPFMEFGIEGNKLYFKGNISGHYYSEWTETSTLQFGFSLAEIKEIVKLLN